MYFFWVHQRCIGQINRLSYERITCNLDLSVFVMQIPHPRSTQLSCGSHCDQKLLADRKTSAWNPKYLRFTTRPLKDYKKAGPVENHTCSYLQSSRVYVRLWLLCNSSVKSVLICHYFRRARVRAAYPYLLLSYGSSLRYRYDMPDSLGPQQHRVLLRLRDRSRI